MGILEGKFSVNTKWSKGDIIKPDGEIGVCCRLKM